MTRACVVLSPGAGSAVSPDNLTHLLAPLRDAGWQLRVVVSSQPGETTSLAQAAVADGDDVVIAAGGDGTVNEVIQALVGTEVALGVLPLGTGNVWAHEVGIPIDLPGAVCELRDGRVRKVDVGQASSRYFLMMAGVGFDAAVTRVTDRKSKRRFGRLAYLVSGIPVALSFVGHRLEINSDGERRGYRALLVVIGNSRLYGGDVRVTAEACIDDGLLDVCVFKGTGVFQAVWHILSVVLGRHLHDPGVEYFRARRLTINCASPLPVQVDGDTIGETPAAFQVRSRALNVLVPRTVRPGLFTEAEPLAEDISLQGG